VGEWVERRCLAAIDATTGRVTDWDPRANSGVESMLVHGGKVYVGGYFSSVGGQPRGNIAALDPVSLDASIIDGWMKKSIAERPSAVV
jgi:hypothetical protein